MKTAWPLSSVVCVSTTLPFCFNAKVTPFRYFLAPPCSNFEDIFLIVTSLLVASNAAFLTTSFLVGLNVKSAVFTLSVPDISSVALFPSTLSFDLVNFSSLDFLVNLTK